MQLVRVTFQRKKEAHALLVFNLLQIIFFTHTFTTFLCKYFNQVGFREIGQVDPRGPV